MSGERLEARYSLVAGSWTRLAEARMGLMGTSIRRRRGKVKSMLLLNP